MSSTSVSKGYLRSALVRDELKELLMKAGRRIFLKYKKGDLMQLIPASARGDRKQVRLLLEMGADVNMRNSVSYG